jgi:hypothetical protein
MNAETLGDWLLVLLRQRGVRPDGRLLFSYDLGQDEYEQLIKQLRRAIVDAGGIEELAELSLGRRRLAAPPAAFVLFASEWWKHEYAGGAWSWAPVLDKLGVDSAQFPPQLRSEFVARGLSFWQLSPLDKGKAFIGAIVVNGGIPMRLLAHGEGPVALVISQVLKLASRYHWGNVQVLAAVTERLVLLPNAYRQSQIAQLLTRFVEIALYLKDEYQLEGVMDPVARLDCVLPDWRRRFPVSLESEAAQAMLTGLVREAAAQGTGSTHGLFIAERRLVLDPATACFALESHLSYPGRIPAQDVATLFGLHDLERVPRHFTIDLEAGVRQPLAEGRLVLGSSNPVAVLSVRKWVLRNQAARTELQLILRSQAGDQGERCTIEGGCALPEKDPWIFVESEAGYQVLAAAGGARLPHDSVWVALAPGWTIETTNETTNEVEPNGELHCPGMVTREVFCLRSDASLISPGLAFRIRLGQITQPSQIYQWKGVRLPEARGRSVFRSAHPPRLFRTTEEGLQIVPTSDQEWRLIGTQEVLQPRDARGPVEVRILDEGEMVARQRFFMLPPDARIEYSSGQALGTAQVRFVNWGLVDLAPETPANVTAVLSKSGTGSFLIDLLAHSAPPAEFRVSVRWPGRNTALTLTLPYPVSGGRFLCADGSVMQEQETVTLRELIGMRLQIFDTNPDQPKRYEVQLTLGSGKQQVSSRLPVPMLPGVGRAELRLLDYQHQIESLLGLFDDLDAKVKVSLLAGGQSSCEIRVGRYATTIQSEDGHVRVPETALGLITVDDLASTRVLACSLTQPHVKPHELHPVLSEGVHTGSWAGEGMSQELAPWLVYPAPDSSVQFRPLVWVEARHSAEAAVVDREMVTGPISLSDAMSQADPEMRRSSMYSALKAMSQDHRNECWHSIDGLWDTFHHLPLTALDLWRMLAKQPKAMLSFLLVSELDEAELVEALRRFRIETAWMPELTTVADLCEVAQTFWQFWVAQGLDRDRCHKYFKDELESRFKLLANEIPSLGPLIDTAIFAATGSMSELLMDVAGPSQQATRDLLRQLWEGSNSLVNSQLFLVNQGREQWPGRDFVERFALPAFLETCPSEHGEKIRSHLPYVFWKFQDWTRYYGTQFSAKSQTDYKFSVANLPILCALWAATSTSRQWWSDPRSRLALKQIRDFDPIWFEQAYRQAFKVCMSIEGLVQLPVITDK